MPDFVGNLLADGLVGKNRLDDRADHFAIFLDRKTGDQQLVAIHLQRIPPDRIALYHRIKQRCAGQNVPNLAPGHFRFRQMQQIDEEVVDKENRTRFIKRQNSLKRSIHRQTHALVVLKRSMLQNIGSHIGPSLQFPLCYIYAKNMPDDKWRNYRILI